MFDRTSLDLRLAEHRTITVRINASEWQREGQPPRRVIRAALAAALVVLAARLDPARPAPRRSHAAGTYAAAPGPR